MVDFNKKEKYDIDDLLEIMRLLRAPGGCPWDAEQTHMSIKKDLIEETYEVIEAINKDDKELMTEELGDLLMQVVFHSQMEQEAGNFDFGDVTDGICKKLIERHPHVFGEVEVSSVGDVLNNWPLKGSEKGERSHARYTERASRAHESDKDSAEGGCGRLRLGRCLRCSAEGA